MLRNAKKTEYFNTWLLHLVCMKESNDLIEQMIICYNNYPLSSEGNKLPLQLHIISSLKRQDINIMIDSDALNYLNEWQVIDPLHEGQTPMSIEPPQDATATND